MTPAQMAVHLICGYDIPKVRDQSLTARMKQGHAMLVDIAKVDYGYDLQRWHDHLKVLPRSATRGYTWNKTIALPKLMQVALLSDEWLAAARELSDETSHK